MQLSIKFFKTLSRLSNVFQPVWFRDLSIYKIFPPSKSGLDKLRTICDWALGCKKPLWCSFWYLKKRKPIFSQIDITMNFKHYREHQRTGNILMILKLIHILMDCETFNMPYHQLITSFCYYVNTREGLWK